MTSAKDEISEALLELQRSMSQALGVLSEHGEPDQFRQAVNDFTVTAASIEQCQALIGVRP